MKPLEELVLKVTTACERKCIHCSCRGGAPLPNELTIDELINVLYQFKELGGKRLNIDGGDPMYRRKDVFRLLKYTEGLDDIRIFTSCTTGALSEEELNELATLKIKVFLSFYSANPFIFDRITNTQYSFQKSFELTLALKKAGIYVGWSYVLMKPNKNDFYKLVQLAKICGVEVINVLRFVPQGRGADNRYQLEITPHEFKEFLDQFMKLRKDLETPKLRLSNPCNFLFLYDPSNKPGICEAGISSCTIEANGNVLPCPAFEDLPMFIAGNIRQQNLRDIWEKSKVFNEIRKTSASIENFCKCKYYMICRGRCPAQRVYAYGRMEGGPDPICPKKFFQI